MKKTYIQPASTIIVLPEDLCGYLHASVEHGITHENVDKIDVVEEDKTLDWGADSWGGD